MPLSDADLTADVIRDSGINKQYSLQGLLLFAQIDRSFVVEGLAAAGATPELATSVAENFIKLKVPVGTPHPNDALCTARYYNVRPILQATDAVTVVVSYVFTTPGVDGQVWQIESYADTEVEDTDAQYDANGNLVPIKIDNYIAGWHRPTDPIPQHVEDVPLLGQTSLPDSPELAAFATVVVPRRQKQWVYTKTIVSPADAQTFDNASTAYVGCLNSTTFTGVTANGVNQNLSCPPGTVFCMNAGLTIKPWGGSRICTVHLAYKPQGWQPYVRWESRITGGDPGNTWREAFDGSYAANGVVRTTAIPYADLNALLALI